MLHIINTWLQSRIVREDEGATMVEYGLMVALIAVVSSCRCHDRAPISLPVRRGREQARRLKAASQLRRPWVLPDRRSSSHEGNSHMIHPLPDI